MQDDDIGLPTAIEDYSVTSDREAINYHFDKPDFTVRPARPICLLDGPPPPKPPVPPAPSSEG